MESINLSGECLICYETFRLGKHDYESCSSSLSFSTEGIFCGNGHFCCNEDLRKFCSENVFSKIFQVRETKGKIPCPHPDCDSNLDAIIVASKLNPQERMRFNHLISEVVFEQDRRIKQMAGVFRDMLTLVCPGCRNAVDPFPDACSAIMCLNCSAHYCNYCFQLFKSGDSNKDRSDCHIHVATHNTKPTGTAGAGDPFLSHDLVLEGQKTYTASRLTQSLQLALSSPEYAGDSLHFVGIALVPCYDDIFLLSIDPIRTWFQAVDAMTANPFVRNQTRTNEVAEELPERIQAKRSGKMLANALISKNEVAIRQILSAYKDELDCNYRESVNVGTEGKRVSYPLVTLAILMGYGDVAVELLRLGADLFAKDDSNGRACLYVAIEKSCKEVVDYACTEYPHPIDWNHPLSDEVSQYHCLQVAAHYGHAHLIERFVSLGTDLEKVDEEHGYPPLTTAMLCNRPSAAIECVRLGSDIYHAAKRGATPIFVVIERGMLSVLREMAKKHPTACHSSLKPQEPRKMGALHQAIAFNMNHLLSFLVDKQKVDVNDMDNADSISPFAKAVLYSNTVAAKFLLSRDVDVSCSFIDRLFRLPMFAIVERGFTDLLRALLRKNPRLVNEPCDKDPKKSYPPLMVAVLFNQTASLEILLEHGANIDAQEKSFHYTATMSAGSEQQFYNFQLLLSHSPNIYLLNRQHRNLMYIIAEKGLVEIFYMLVERFPDLDVNGIVGEDADVTALHVACTYKKPSIISCLMERGANPTIRNKLGKTAFDICDEVGAEECKNILTFYSRPE